MKCALPGWLEAREPNRSRNFMVIKVVLFLCLVIEVAETILYSPIYYQILKGEAKLAPVGDDFNVWIVILSTVLSVAFGISIISVGIIGILKENFTLVLIYAIILVVAITVSLFLYGHLMFVIFSVITNAFVAILAFVFCHMIRKYNKRLGY